MMKFSYTQEIVNEFENLQYFQIREYDYEHRFKSFEHNGRILSDEERKEFVAYVNDVIASYSSGLPMIHESLDSSRNCHDEFHSLEYTVSSMILFVLMVSIDCMVASKYFIMADTDYDRRYMRGKMKVILNEGFKKLYGFDSKKRKKSEWNRLGPLMSHFPAAIQRQYEELTHCLDEHSKSSSWWRDERNLETHLEAEKLYISRMEENVESKVMIDSLKLFDTLQAVNQFLTNAHACITNYLINKYKQGELSLSDE